MNGSLNSLPNLNQSIVFNNRPFIQNPSTYVGDSDLVTLSDVKSVAFASGSNANFTNLNVSVSTTTDALQVTGPLLSSYIGQNSILGHLNVGGVISQEAEGLNVFQGDVTIHGVLTADNIAGPELSSGVVVHNAGAPLYGSLLLDADGVAGLAFQSQDLPSASGSVRSTVSTLELNYAQSLVMAKIDGVSDENVVVNNEGVAVGTHCFVGVNGNLIGKVLYGDYLSIPTSGAQNFFMDLNGNGHCQSMLVYAGITASEVVMTDCEPPDVAGQNVYLNCNGVSSLYFCDKSYGEDRPVGRVFGVSQTSTGSHDGNMYFDYERQLVFRDIDNVGLTPLIITPGANLSCADISTKTVHASQLATFTGGVSATGAISATGLISTTGNMSCTGALTASGSFVSSGTSTLTGVVNCGGSLNVAGLSTTTGGINLLGATQMVGAVTGAAAVTLTGVIDFSGAFTSNSHTIRPTFSLTSPKVTLKDSSNNTVDVTNDSTTLIISKAVAAPGVNVPCDGSVGITFKNGATRRARLFATTTDSYFDFDGTMRYRVQSTSSEICTIEATLGYTGLLGGMPFQRMQSGVYTFPTVIGPGADESSVVNFPIAFPTVPKVLLTNRNNLTVVVSGYATSTTLFVINAHNTSVVIPPDFPPLQVQWFAWG